MRQFRALFCAAAIVLSGAMPAYAYTGPDFNAAPPIPHMREASVTQSEPRVMNYTDQMAQSLGVKDGEWQAFKSRDPLIPSLNGGVGSGGAPMLKLQWKP